MFGGGLLISILRPCFCSITSGGFGSVICEHAVPELRGDLARVDLVGDRECPLEGAVGALRAVHGAAFRLFLLIMVGAFLALDRKLIADEGHLDFLLVHARQSAVSVTVLSSSATSTRGTRTPPMLRPNQSSKRESIC
jgi:hypothetical protein